MWWHSIVCSLSLLHGFFVFASSGLLVGYYFWWCIYCELLLIYWMSFIIDSWLLLINGQLFIGGVLLLELVICGLLLLMIVVICLSLCLWLLTLISRWLYIFGLGICMLTWYVVLVLDEYPFNFDYLFLLSRLYYPWGSFSY